MANISKVELNGTTYNINTSGSIPESEKGAANGVASLDSSGKVPSSQLPSYVDDILEYSAKSSFPTTGETGKIYVDTTTNKTYRWSGSAYVEISASLALGETSSTAYRGDRGKAAYNHSQITNGNPHGTTGANTNLTGYSKGSSKDAVAATDTVNAAIAKHENRINANQSNILYVSNQIGKNVINARNYVASGQATGITVTVNDDCSVTLNGTSSSSNNIIYGYFDADVKPNTRYAMKGTGNSNVKVQLIGYNDINNPTVIFNDVNDNVGSSGNWQHYRIRLWIAAKPSSGTQFSNVTIYPMLCPEELWNISHDFAPYALPNYDLTRLEAEDRASLAEVVDSGAKNLWDFANAVFDKDSAATHTKTDSDITVTSSGTWGMSSWKITLPAGSYVFRCKIANLSVASGTEARIRVSDGSTAASSTWANTSIITANGIVTDAFTTTGGTVYIQYYATYGTGSSRTNTFKASENMVCTKAAFGVSQKFVPFGNDPFYQVPINHNMIYRGRNLGASLTDAQHTALSSGNFTDLYLGDYWTKTVTIPAGTYTGGDGQEVAVPAQTNITLKAVIADFDTFYAGYASTYAGINTHHAAVIVTGFSNVVWNKTNSTAGGYVASLIHKWLVGSALPQIESWFGAAKVLSHQKLLTNAITGDAASGWAWSSQKISLLSENQMYGSKVWGNSKAANGGYEPGEAFKHLNVFNHIDANLLFGNKNIWLRDIASAVWAADLYSFGANYGVASNAWVAPAALILLS